jgi:hypothetical protein
LLDATRNKAKAMSRRLDVLLQEFGIAFDYVTLERSSRATFGAVRKLKENGHIATLLVPEVRCPHEGCGLQFNKARDAKKHARSRKHPEILTVLNERLLQGAPEKKVPEEAHADAEEGDNEDIKEEKTGGKVSTLGALVHFFEELLPPSTYAGSDRGVERSDFPARRDPVIGALATNLVLSIEGYRLQNPQKPHRLD